MHRWIENLSEIKILLIYLNFFILFRHFISNFREMVPD